MTTLQISFSVLVFLVALSLAIRTSLLGKTGFIRVAEQCLAKASYLRGRILELGAYGPRFADAIRQ